MVPYPDIENLPEPLAQQLATRRPLNVFRMVMHAPGFAPAYFSMADAVRNCSFAPALRELVILRVGHAYNAPYELHHHEKIARSAGLCEDAIAVAAHGGDIQRLELRERQLLMWTDSLLEQHALRGADRESAISVLGLNGLAELVFIVGFYQQVCNFLLTFDIEVENDS